MTDTYVENLIINKFLEIESLEAIPKCYQYYEVNKENNNTLEAFESFKPDYPEELQTQNKPAVPDEPTKPVLPDFNVDNPDTGIPWTEEEKEQAIQEYKDAMEVFKIEYADYKEKKSKLDEWEDKRSKIDGPLLSSLIVWFRDTYPEYYATPEGSTEDDLLYDDIKNIVPQLTSIRRTIKIYNEDGVKLEGPIFPNVAFPNDDFIRPVDSNGNNTFWYELYFIPAAPSQHELGTKGRSRWYGVMQINICIPKTWGTDELYSRYDEIASLFRSGLILEGVRITKTYRYTAIDDDDFYCLPVIIGWQSDLDR